MAKKKKGHRHAARRSNPSRRRGHRSRFRRNPAGFKSLFPRVLNTAKNAALGVGGKVVARKVRNLTGQKPGTVVGSLVETGVSLGLVALGTFVPKIAGITDPLAVGAMMAPIETAIQQFGIPGISDSLADDGFLLGADVELVSAYDDQISGYVEGPQGSAMAGYVEGPVRAAA